MNSLPNVKAWHPTIGHNDYHAHKSIGASMLETFRRSRREYHARYVARTLKDKPSDAMQFGTAVHILVLEPEKAADAIAEPMPTVAPDGKKWMKRKGSDHEKWWKEELEKRAGKLTLSDADYRRAQEVAAAVRENEQAQKFLSRQGEAEYTIFWIDQQTGLELACRVDWMSSVALDLKTTRDPEPRAYATQLASLGYHRKKAHYEAGLRALFGEKAPPFAHLAVETSAPYRVACYELDDRDKDGNSLGRTQRRSMLHELAKCYETDDWSEVWERRPKRLALPGWSFYEDEYTYTEAIR